jgi:hypothetical protein
MSGSELTRVKGKGRKADVPAAVGIFNNTIDTFKKTTKIKVSAL